MLRANAWDARNFVSNQRIRHVGFFNCLNDPFKKLKVLKSRPFMKSFVSQKSYDWMTFSIILYDYILSKNELIWAEFLQQQQQQQRPKLDRSRGNWEYYPYLFPYCQIYKLPCDPSCSSVGWSFGQKVDVLHVHAPIFFFLRLIILPF